MRASGSAKQLKTMIVMIMMSGVAHAAFSEGQSLGPIHKMFADVRPGGPLPEGCVCVHPSDTQIEMFTGTGFWRSPSGRVHIKFSQTMRSFFVNWSVGNGPNKCDVAFPATRVKFVQLPVAETVEDNHVVLLVPGYKRRRGGYWIVTASMRSSRIMEGSVPLGNFMLTFKHKNSLHTYEPAEYNQQVYEVLEKNMCCVETAERALAKHCFDPYEVHDKLYGLCMEMNDGKHPQHANRMSYVNVDDRSAQDFIEVLQQGCWSSNAGSLANFNTLVMDGHGAKTFWSNSNTIDGGKPLNTALFQYNNKYLLVLRQSDGQKCLVAPFIKDNRLKLEFGQFKKNPSLMVTTIYEQAPGCAHKNLEVH